MNWLDQLMGTPNQPLLVDLVLLLFMALLTIAVLVGMVLLIMLGLIGVRDLLQELLHG